ncbi:MAG: DNA translocase FtsK [Bacteroidetes bacterium]|nr:MAG: DNA translocase FtsK [Bacteroidota bacterium]
MPIRTNQLKRDEAAAKKTRSKTTKKKSTKKRSTKSGRSWFDFLRNEKFLRLCGFFLVLLSFYLLLSFISYLVNWFSGSSDDLFTAIPFRDVLVNENLVAANWGGRMGAALSGLFIKKWFGASSLLFCLFFFVWGYKLLFQKALLPLGKTFRWSFIALLWLSLAFALIFKNSEMNILGGIFGYELNNYLDGFVGPPGTIFLLVFVFFGFLIINFNFKLGFRKKEPKESADDDNPGKNKPKEDIYNTVEFSVTEDEKIEKDPVPAEQNEDVIEETEKAESDLPFDNPATDAGEEEEKPDSGIELTIEETEVEKTLDKSTTAHHTIDTEYDPKLDLGHYKYPTLDLLDDHGEGGVGVEKEELESNKEKIVNTLLNYNIKIDKIKATIGPTVTLYEIIPAPGVRISKIKNLEDDIALSLSAMGIRIIAPIPGKGTIGIEVPNQKSDTVSMKSILSSEKFQNAKYELPFGLGKTIANESYIADLTKMPHILMAGATGQGKSVGLNAILTSLLYKKHPAELKFILVDPKKVELTLFSKIERHFLAKLPDSEEAIITDTRKVVRTLNSLSIEMDHRYELLKDAQVRNIKEYNVKFINRKLNPEHGHKYLPYLVLVVDEFADLIMTAGKEIENPLTRLAQLARAVGIHLIIATQRPSVNIITGTIKANFPARIAYRVISKIDSRTILDTGGADQLIGRGDMLLSTGSELVRLQCAFVDTPEIERITDFIGSQRAYPHAFHLPEYADEEQDGPNDFDPNDRDELFEEAARIIVQTQQGSTSLLQRKLKLGYNRAGRIIDQLEAAGIVGPFEGSKAREVIILDEHSLDQFLKSLNEPNEL